MRVHTHLPAVALAVALGLTTAACDSGSASADPATEEAVDLTAAPTIAVVDNAFEPVHAEVAAGTRVEWSWQETGTQHNVVGDGFESPLQDGGMFAHTFAKPGTYAYRCTVHGPMKGAVTVTEGA